MNLNNLSSFPAEPLPAKNILANDVEIIGTLKYEGELIFDGKLDGKIISGGALTLVRNSVVNGDIETKSVTLHGTVNGNISASEHGELKANSQLNGDMKAMRVVIEGGATFIGKSEVASANFAGFLPDVRVRDDTGASPRPRARKLHIAIQLAAILLVVVIPPAAMQSFLGPLLRMGTAAQEQIGSMGKGLKALDEVEADNNFLRDIEAENDRLRLALEYREKSGFRLLSARLVSRDASTWWNTVKINQGSEAGVETDQPVMTYVGLVGKTTAVSKNESTVVLVTDEACRIAAEVEGTRERGILSGMRIHGNGIKGELQLNFLTKNAALDPGQKVYTAGSTNGVFPSGILIGTVKEFRTRLLDGQAIVDPAVDVLQTEDVFVVVGAKGKNLGASPEAFQNMNSEFHDKKLKQASGYQTQRE